MHTGIKAKGRIKGKRKSRTVVAQVISAPGEPLKAGPNAPQCHNCRRITPRTENSIVNARYNQTVECPGCGTLIHVPKIRSSE